MNSIGIKTSLFSIVVVGDMNPAIHHPLWYKTTELITGEEADEALKRPVLSVPAPVLMNQFDTGTFSVICNQGAWEIRTSDVNQMGRIGELTRKTFDEILKHTPVRMYGYNYIIEYTVGRPGVGRILGEFACRTGLDFGAAAPTASEIKVVEPRGEAVVGILVKPGSDDALVSVATNVEYRPERTEFGFFDLGVHLDREYEARWREADRVGRSIAAVIADSE